MNTKAIFFLLISFFLLPWITQGAVIGPVNKPPNGTSDPDSKTPSNWSLSINLGPLAVYPGITTLFQPILQSKIPLDTGYSTGKIYPIEFHLQKYSNSPFQWVSTFGYRYSGFIIFDNFQEFTLMSGARWFFNNKKPSNDWYLELKGGAAYGFGQPHSIGIYPLNIAYKYSEFDLAGAIEIGYEWTLQNRVMGINRFSLGMTLTGLLPLSGKAATFQSFYEPLFWFHRAIAAPRLQIGVSF